MFVYDDDYLENYYARYSDFKRTYSLACLVLFLTRVLGGSRLLKYVLDKSGNYLFVH